MPIDIPFIVPFGRDGAADRAAWAYADRFSHPVSSPKAGMLDTASFRAMRPGAAPDRAKPRAGGPAPNLLIENHPGSGGLRGVQRANALARAGGAVLLLATPSTHILLPARSGEGAAIDAAFVPVVVLSSAPNVLLVSPRLGVSSVEALIERARSERLTYASAGTGQTTHVCAAYFCALAGISMAHRPYAEGSFAPYEDLVAGRVHAYFDNLLGCHDRIARGEAVPLAVSAPGRAARIPQVPTLAERGFPEHSLDVWLAVFGAHVDAVTAEQLGAGEHGAAELAERIERSRAGWLRALASVSPAA